MEKELLEMAELWKKTALEMLAKSEPASRSELANQMLLACAEMLEWKLTPEHIRSALHRESNKTLEKRDT